MMTTRRFVWPMTVAVVVAACAASAPPHRASAPPVAVASASTSASASASSSAAPEIEPVPAAPAPSASVAPSAVASAPKTPSCGDDNYSGAPPCPKAADCHCALVEVTGAPPCDLQCDSVFINAANIAHAYRTYYDLSGKSPRAIGQVDHIYDGAYDPPSMQSAQMISRYVEIDTSTTPPTLKVRRSGCLVGGTFTTECPVLARLRYDGAKLANVKP